MSWIREKARLRRYSELELPSDDHAPAVPVVVAFTKYDALETKAFCELESSGRTEEAAEAEMPAYAEQLFQQHFLARVMAAPHAPAGHVCLKGTS